MLGWLMIQRLGRLLCQLLIVGMVDVFVYYCEDHHALAVFSRGHATLHLAVSVRR